VAVDHNADLADRVEAEVPGVTVVRNDGTHRGASATRNAGARAALTTLTAFLDDDEFAAVDWLERLVAPFTNPGVVGTGGAYLPNWLGGKPRWFPDEFGWAIGGAYTGLPLTTSPIRNVWSGNMAVRTSLFHAVGGFRDDFGKLGARSRPEDTELCIRMARSVTPQGAWMYVPDAVVHHEVPPERTSFRFFVGRCYAEGRGKVEMSRHLRGIDIGHLPQEAERSFPLEAERSFLTRTVPRGAFRHAGMGGDGLQRAAAMLVGVGAAGVGATSALLSPRSGRHGHHPVAPLPGITVKERSHEPDRS
jgi:hypothetical protein